MRRPEAVVEPEPVMAPTVAVAAEPAEKTSAPSLAKPEVATEPEPAPSPMVREAPEATVVAPV